MKGNVSRKQLREFGLVIGLIFPIIVGWILPIMAREPFRIWTLWLGIPFVFFGILRPSLLAQPYKLWMKLGNILGWLNGKIILGLVFLLVVQPIAFFMKFFGYDPLRTKKNHEKSYRENKKFNKIDLNRIF
tara:strand:+ start:23 stop:415 length:393 start_codon:yes stop_codon:yes gene_type:complete